jgi:succinoglycan biosynthesis protein ExoM
MMAVSSPNHLADARAEPSASTPLHVCVAALTRERPAMLAQLLRSWRALIQPTGVETTFLVVENNDVPTGERAVEEFAAAVAPHQVRYVLEPRIGIPFARNRAVAEMLKSDAALLLFVDDDETVAPDWLQEMVGEFRRSNALLIGGPVLAAAPSFDLPWLPGQVFKGVSKRYSRKALRAAKRVDDGNPQATTVVTSNWLGHRDLFEKYNLRFDEGLAFSGGSDAKFDDRVTAAGLEKSWAKNAYVTETIPWSRLSAGYQFRRGRDQSIASFQRRLGREPARAMLLLPVELLLRLIFVILLAAAVPLTGGRSLLDLARAAGWSVGRCVALIGARSRLYETVTGE